MKEKPYKVLRVNHQSYISAKFCYNWLRGFWEKDINVKLRDTDDEGSKVTTITHKDLIFNIAKVCIKHQSINETYTQVCKIVVNVRGNYLRHNLGNE